MQLSVVMQGLEKLKSNSNETIARIAEKGILVGKATRIVTRAVVLVAGGGRPGPNRQTGRFVGSIQAEMLSPLEGRVGTSLIPHYAPDLEYGHKTRPDKHGISKGYVPAYPSFGPGLENAQPLIDALCEEFGQEIQVLWES